MVRRNREIVGRYEPTRTAKMPVDGLARPPVTPNVQSALAVVDDPWSVRGDETFATVNRRTDVLETERSHRRISEAAYRTGREIQAIFEAGARLGGGSTWQDSVRSDPNEARIIAQARNISIAQNIVREMRRLTTEVGEIGAEFLREVLGGVGFAEIAARTSAGSQPTRAEISVVAGQFRSTLASIVRHREARGYDPRPVETPDDMSHVASTPRN